jgi:hypothetical protein
MDQNEFNARIRDEVNRWATVKSNESRAFLKWFLINYYRLDEDIAEFHICDNPNDKGIDGIYTDDFSNIIFVFQSKYSPKGGADQGDSDLRNFYGVKAWFESPANIESLDNTIANQELKDMVNRLEISTKIEQGWTIVQVFVTNKTFNRDAQDYLSVAGEDYEAWDFIKLFNAYTYAGKDIPVEDKFSFSLDDHKIISYTIPVNVEVFLFPARAKEIVQLKGIQDSTLFDKNVRYWLGNTRINREIARTLSIVGEHDRFFLYNNGITIICEDATDAGQKLDVENYSVVNGCQTVLTLYNNQDALADNIRVLIKVIKTGKDEELGRRITRFNNNQNAISPRDLKSNDKVQQDIQKQFFEYFNNEVIYNIKRGEPLDQYKVVIPNDFAAQLITAFVLKEPHTTHQKTAIFTEKYQQIFTRHISPPLIFLLYEMYRIINENCSEIKNEGVSDYKTTRFFLIYLFREILDEDELGKGLLGNADSFYKTYKDVYGDAFDKLSKMLILDFNNYVESQEENEQYFEYKNILRNAQRTKEMAKQILTDYKKGLIHHPEESFDKMLVAGLKHS